MLTLCRVCLSISALLLCGCQRPARPPAQPVGSPPFVGIWGTPDGSTLAFKADGTYLETNSRGMAYRGNWSEAGGVISVRLLEPAGERRTYRWGVREEGRTLRLVRLVALGLGSGEREYRRLAQGDAPPPAPRPIGPQQFRGVMPARPAR